MKVEWPKKTLCNAPMRGSDSTLELFATGFSFARIDSYSVPSNFDGLPALDTKVG